MSFSVPRLPAKRVIGFDRQLGPGPDPDTIISVWQTADYSWVGRLPLSSRIDAMPIAWSAELNALNSDTAFLPFIAPPPRPFGLKATLLRLPKVLLLGSALVFGLGDLAAIGGVTDGNDRLAQLLGALGPSLADANVSVIPVAYLTGVNFAQALSMFVYGLPWTSNIVTKDQADIAFGGHGVVTLHAEPNEWLAGEVLILDLATPPFDGRAGPGTGVMTNLIAARQVEVANQFPAYKRVAQHSFVLVDSTDPELTDILGSVQLLAQPLAVYNASYSTHLETFDDPDHPLVVTNAGEIMDIVVTTCIQKAVAFFGL